MNSSLRNRLLQNPGAFDAFLLDIDGTVLLDRSPVSGAPEFVHFLRRNRLPFRFLTNNSSQNHVSLARRLTRAGVEAVPDDFVTCADPAANYFRQSNTSGREWRYFVIGPAEDIPGVVRFESDPARIMECDGVLHNGGIHDWCADLSAIFNFFLRFPLAPFLVSNPDHLNPLPDGVSICANGQSELVIHLLHERGIDKERIYLGKPYAPVYGEALARLGLHASKRILGIGDLLTSDILGANRAGLSSALVLTGLSTRRDAEQAASEARPDFIFSSLS